MEIILYIATSKDGFIADDQGSVSWLDKYQDSGEDCGYPSFYKSIDAIVFGKNTYEQVLTFGDWPYPDKMSYIFADKNMQPANDQIAIVVSDIPTFLKSIEPKNYKHLWLMGGAQLIQSFQKLDLIDECIITVLPDVLKTGIPLLPALFKGEDFDLITSTSFDNLGAVQLHYRKKKRK